MYVCPIQSKCVWVTDKDYLSHIVSPIIPPSKAEIASAPWKRALSLKPKAFVSFFPDSDYFRHLRVHKQTSGPEVTLNPHGAIIMQIIRIHIHALTPHLPHSPAAIKGFIFFFQGPGALLSTMSYVIVYWNCDKYLNFF